MSSGAFSRTMITALAVVMLVATASGKDSPQESGIANPLVARAMQYAFPDETRPAATSDRTVPAMSLGAAGVATASPGVKIGDTWYDYQHNGSMGRMIDWGWDASEGFIIHFSFMNLPSPVPAEREYAYNCYYGKWGSQLGETGLQPSDEYAGYVGIDVTDDNRAVLGGHNDQWSGAQSHFYWDYGPGYAYFGGNRRVDDSVAACVTGDPVRPVIWPKFRYQDIAGETPVLHVLAQVAEPGDAPPQALVYFRKVGVDYDGTWDYCPYVVDTVFNISHDVACSNTDGTVALVWTANLPEPGDCDTCSSNNGAPFAQWDNDLYYQISYDYGATFQPRVNVTMNVDGEAGFRPYTDLSALYGTEDALHIAWSGRYWPSCANHGGFIGNNCRIFHWSESTPYIRTVHDANWHQTTCNGGAWQMNVSKMSLSECNDKLYCLWVQFNDPPNGVFDDCAERAFEGDPIGASNGELYLSVSDDMGLTWDLARNLTYSRTPHCDSATGVGGACNSDHWPSVARFGTDVVGDDMSGAQIVTPAGGYDDGWYLDVQYIDDPDPGAIVQNEGSWHEADVRWFRLACVDPEPSLTLDPSYTGIDYPTWTKHGVQLDKTLTIENNGNATLNYSLSEEEDTGPSGWLNTYGLSAGSIPPGLANSVTGDVIINAGGIVNDPGTIVHLSGRLIFNSDAPSSPDTITVNAWVADTLIVPEWDTVYAGGEYNACLALLVGSNGNMGGHGNGGIYYNSEPISRLSGDGSSGGLGQVNMDFFNYGDCDTEDSIPGATEVYLFDGSPVICWDDGGEVRCNWSIFGDGFHCDCSISGDDYLSENGFLPLARWPVDDSGFCDLYHSEFMTRDTGIKVDNYIFAPKTGHPDSCHFLLQKLRFTVLDGMTHTGLAIGEAIDWDIPSDSGVRNSSGFDHTKRLIYQQGREYYQDMDVACQDNDWRYGGMAMAEICENGSHSEDFHGAYTMDNASQVYPTQGFVPDSLFMYMEQSYGYTLSDSTEADLHSVMTFKNDYSLAPEDTLEVFVCLVSGKDGLSEFETSAQACLQWYDDHIRPEPGYVCGDVNDDGNVDVSDLTDLVAYLFQGGSAPPIMEAADLDGFPGVNVADLSYLVKYLFAGGPPPICGKRTSRSAQPGGHVYLDYVDGLYNSSRYIRAGEPITFHIRVSNVIGTKGADIAGLTNGLRIYSPTGTPISVNSAAGTSDFEDSTSLDGGRFVNSFSAGDETIGFGGYALSGAGVPDGLDMVAYTITLDPIDAGYRGSEICLDSTWYPPSNEWIWATGSEIYAPDWGGPYCFTVVDPVDLVADFTATPNAGDTSTVFQFYADTTGAPDWWDWNFGDGQHSSDQNPTHQYANSGRFDVTLTVHNTVEESAPHKKLQFIQVRNILLSDLYAEVNINAWGSRPGYDIWYWCSFHNAGNLNAQNCTLKVLLPAVMAFEGIRDSSGSVISPGQYSFVGDTIVMPLGTIEPSNDWNRIVPYGILSSEVTPGLDTLVTEMWLSTTTADGNSRNDYVRHAQIVTDPSKSNLRATYSADKSASPNGTNLAYAVEPDQRLSYTVAFENAAEATAPISSIEVVDTLDANLDWSSGSLSIGEMSHPNACTFVGFDCLTGELTWFCNKINLPPNANPPEGEGYITYSANPDQGLVSGAEIINIAYLKFGFDDPIPVPGTNGLYRRIGDCCIPSIRGDINYDNAALIDIADLVYLVDFMFNKGPDPICFEEGDVDGSGVQPIDIADLVYLVDFMFNKGPAPADCP